jgi:hypothetical protein
MKKLIISFLIAHFSFLISQMSMGQVIHVPVDQPTIQAGIEAATSGDTVLVADGTYLENINFNGKAITVASHYIMDSNASHIDNTVIDGGQNGSVVSFITGEDSTSVLCGFTITGGTGFTEPTYGARIGGGIVCHNAVAKIVRNNIMDNEINAAALAFGAGIACVREYGADWMVIENNTITGNVAVASAGAATSGGIEAWGNCRIVNNIISENESHCNNGDVYGCGIFHQPVNFPPDTMVLRNNTIQGNAGFASLYAYGGGVFSQYAVGLISDNVIIQNTLSGQDLYGGGMAIEDCASLTVSGNEIGHNSLTGGNTYGGGINLMYGSDMQVLKNSIHNNTVSTSESWWLGAGMYCLEPGEILISENEFTSNSGPVASVGGGGGLCLLDAFETSVTVSSNYFSLNTAYNGGGIFERNCFNLQVKNNIFRNNFAYRGGAIGMFHPATQSTNTGDGSRVDHPLVINNTFRSNQASNDGGGLRFQGDLNAPEILNCIFWDNTAPTGGEIENTSSLTIDISYCDVETSSIYGSWTGEGNIYADPQFNPLDPYCHLLPSSPCRDTGIVNANTPTFDFDGEPRPDPVFGMIDIGADEFYGDLPATPVAVSSPEYGCDYFVAAWHVSDLASGYYLDVAYDEEFESILPEYNGYDVGSDTSFLVDNLQAGSFYYYRVKAYNEWGVSEYSNTIEVDLCVGTEEFTTHHSPLTIQTWPNPTTGIYNLRFTIYSLQSVSCSIYDVHGREVAQVFDGNLPAGTHVVQHDLSGLPEGVYLCKLAVGSRQLPVKKVLKIH